MADEYAKAAAEGAVPDSAVADRLRRDQPVLYGASVYRGAVACSCPVDLRAPGRPPKKVQAPTWERSSAQAPSESMVGDT